MTKAIQILSLEYFVLYGTTYHVSATGNLQHVVYNQWPSVSCVSLVTGLVVMIIGNIVATPQVITMVTIVTVEMMAADNLIGGTELTSDLKS